MRRHRFICRFGPPPDVRRNTLPRVNAPACTAYQRQWSGGLNRTLQFGDSCIEIKKTDVTDNQPSNTGVLSDTTHDIWRRMQRTFCADGDFKVHDLDIRSLRELDKFRIGPGLVGTEDDRYILGFHAVCQSRHIAMRYSQRGHGQSLPVKYRRRSVFVTSTTPTSRGTPPPRAPAGTQRRAQHLKCAGFLIEEATKESRKAWAARCPKGRRWAMAPCEPDGSTKGKRQVGNVIGMKVADGDHR